MNKIILFFLTCVLFTRLSAQNFNTEGNGIRNVVTATISGNDVLYISEVDGAISCYKTNGDKLWRNNSQDPAVMFEIEAVDIDNDGNDDLLAASGDGHIYAWKSDGTLLWKFNPGHKVRFNEVAVIGKGVDLRIFAGGNDYRLYEINTIGKLVNDRPIGGSIRKIEAGDFIEEGKEILFVYTLKHDKYRSEFFGFIQPEQFNEVLKSTTIDRVIPEGGNRFMLHDVSIADINKDGRDDIVMFGGEGAPKMVGIDGDFNRIAEFKGSKKDKQRYVHAIGTTLLPYKDEIVLQYGGLIYRLDLEGNILSRTGEAHRKIIYADFVSVSNNLIGCGQVGGGNGLYFYPLSKKEWWNTDHKFQGRIAKVEENIDELYKQVLNFKLPKYQKKSTKSFNMITGMRPNEEVKKLKGGSVNYIRQFTLSESTDRSNLVKAIGKDALKLDKRQKYELSREDVVDIARKSEADNEPFVIWAGHGMDPFYLQIETLEKILEVAPNMCHGFIYAEIANPLDPRVHYWIDEYLPRMATAIRNNGNKAKIYFRYKSMFWAATSHNETWKKVFFSEKYNDILVPSAEDTNNRLQDLNFSGRVGMFAGGYVDDWAIRLVDDNPTSWRPYSPGGQRSVSPYLRNGASMISYGARYGILFNIRYLEEPGMNVLFSLMKSGVLPIVEKEDILSIGSWHLIKDINEDIVHTADDGHNLGNYKEEDINAVVAVNSVTWCGTTVPDYDYSKISLGVNYRWLHFIPEMPNGMVPVVPSEMESKLKKRGDSYCISDMKVGYVNDKPIAAKDFGKTMQAAVKKGAEKLPLLVKGASWSLIKLDETHARLILIDPGYIDPQQREVVVSFQSMVPLKATDILSGEKITIKNNKINLTVPAGSMRFVDIEYKK
ncbi:PQQ-binding-like beta-propeller repeat protein [Lutibacter citreus]|uniref:PQQ-binding-like beta-propeller repeat protein n=1 Tax=Lutibacter citreus TaxID=2138210 RepID=UPI000DBE95E5|nr:PQQ-binding-like beta-propeller repeat protein [Lutibacter citreus]